MKKSYLKITFYALSFWVVLILAVLFSLGCSSSFYMDPSEENKRALVVKGTSIPEFPDSQRSEYYLYFSQTVDSAQISIVFTESYEPTTAAPVEVFSGVVKKTSNEPSGWSYPIRINPKPGLYFVEVKAFGLGTSIIKRYKYEI